MKIPPKQDIVFHPPFAPPFVPRFIDKGLFIEVGCAAKFVICRPMAPGPHIGRSIGVLEYWDSHHILLIVFEIV